MGVTSWDLGVLRVPLIMVPDKRARRQTPDQWLRWSRLPDPDARWRWLPDLEGERRRRPCAGKWWRPQTPRQWHSQRGRASGAPRRASSDDTTWGTRFKRHHGRREVRAATIARDIILRSGAVRVARVTTSICAFVIDDVLRRLPPRIRIVFQLFCFMPTAYNIYVKNCMILCLNPGFVYQFTACIFFAFILKSNSLIYVVCNYHKNQIKSFMFVNTRCLHML
jgi:hypothetical protein